MPKEILIELQKLHENQQIIKDNAKRFNIIVNGRRWGKTFLAIDLIVPFALEGKRVGYFAPSSKYYTEVWDAVKDLLADAIKTKNETQKRITLITGGIIEFWSLETGNAGRSRKYHRAIIDEFEMAKNMDTQYQQAILPTLTDFKGDLFLLSTPKGKNTVFFNLFEKAAASEMWARYQMPTHTNPYIDPQEIEIIRQSMDDVSFRQEYLAEFIDYANNPFAYAFEDSKHIRKVEIKKGQPIYLSFDFNVNPITAIAAQINSDFIHILQEFRIENSDIYALCDRIKSAFPGQQFFVTGDASGRSRSAMVKGNVGYYQIIQNSLQLANHQLVVPTINPSHQNSRILCNSILTHHKDHLIDPSCQWLIKDLKYVECKPDGSINKDRSSASKEADLLDCWRYLLWAFKNDYISRLKLNP
jgi:hypothetical protein